MENILHVCQALATSFINTFFYLGGTLFLTAIFRLILVCIRTKILKKSLTTKNFSNRLRRLALMHKLEDKIVFVSCSKPFAFCLGAINSKVYLSTKLLSLMKDGELEVILLHEKHHLDKNHNLINLSLMFFQTLFLFIPLVSFVIKRIHIKNELIADETAAFALKNKRNILTALKKLLQYDFYQPSSISSFSHEDTFEKRIKALKGERVTLPYISLKGMLWSIVGMILIFNIMTFLGTRIQAAEIATCGNSNKCQKHCLDESNSSKLPPPTNHVSTRNR